MEAKTKSKRSVSQVKYVQKQRSISSSNNQQVKNTSKKTKSPHKVIAIKIVLSFLNKHVESLKTHFFRCLVSTNHQNCQMIEISSITQQNQHNQWTIKQQQNNKISSEQQISQSRRQIKSQAYQSQISKEDATNSYASMVQKALKSSSSNKQKKSQSKIQISSHLKKKLQNLHRSTTSKSTVQILTADQISAQLKRIREIKSIKNIRGQAYSDIQILLLALRNSQQINRNRDLMESKRSRVFNQENRKQRISSFSKKKVALGVSNSQSKPLVQDQKPLKCSKLKILQHIKKRQFQLARLCQMELCETCQQNKKFDEEVIQMLIKYGQQQSKVCDLSQKLQQMVRQSAAIKRQNLISGQTIKDLGQIINELQSKLTDYQQNQIHFNKISNTILENQKLTNQKLTNQLLAEKRKVFQIRKKLHQQIQISREKTAKIRILQHRSLKTSPSHSDQQSISTNLKEKVQNMRSQIESIKNENLVQRQNRKSKTSNKSKQTILNKLDDKKVWNQSEFQGQIVENASKVINQSKLDSSILSPNSVDNLDKSLDRYFQVQKHEFNLQQQKKLVLQKLSQRKYAEAINDFRILIQKTNWENQSDSDIQIYQHIIKIIEEIQMIKAKNYRLQQGSQKCMSSKILPKNLQKQSSLTAQIEEKIKQRQIQLKEKLRQLAQQKQNLRNRISDLQSQLFQSYKNNEKLQQKAKKLQLDKIQIQQKYIDEILKLQNKYGRQKTDNGSINSLAERQQKISSQSSQNPIKIIKTISREGSNESLIKSLSNSIASLNHQNNKSNQGSDNSLLLETEVQNNPDILVSRQSQNINKFQVLKKKIMKFLEQKQKQREKVWNKTEKYELILLNNSRQLNPQTSDRSLGNGTNYDRSAAECQDEVFLQMMKIQICNLINNQKMYFENFYDRVKQKFAIQNSIHNKTVQDLSSQLKRLQELKEQKIIDSSEQISFHQDQNCDIKLVGNANYPNKEQNKKPQSRVSLYEEQFGSELEIKQKNVKNLQRSLQKYKLEILQLLTDKQSLQEEIQNLNETLKKEKKDRSFQSQNLKNLHQQNLQDIQMQMENIHKQYEIKMTNLKQYMHKQNENVIASLKYLYQANQQSLQQQLQKLLSKDNQKYKQQERLLKRLSDSERQIKRLTDYERQNKRLKIMVDQLQSLAQSARQKLGQAQQQIELKRKQLKEVQIQRKEAIQKSKQAQKQARLARKDLNKAQIQTQETKSKLSSLYDQLRKMEETLNRLEKQLQSCKRQKEQSQKRLTTKQSGSLSSDKQNEVRRNTFDLISQNSRVFNQHFQGSVVLLQKQIESKRHQNIYLRDQIHKQDIQIGQLKNNLGSAKNRFNALQLKISQVEREKIILQSQNKYLKTVESTLNIKFAKKQRMYQENAQVLNQEISRLRNKNNRLKMHIQHQFPLQVTVEEESKSRCNPFNRQPITLVTSQARNFRRQVFPQRGISSQMKSSQGSYIQTLISSKIEAFLNGQIQQTQVLDFLGKQITKLAQENIQLQLRIALFQNSSSISKSSKQNIDILCIFFKTLGKFVQNLKAKNILSQDSNCFEEYVQKSNCYIEKVQYDKVFSGFYNLLQNILQQIVSD